MKYLIIRLILTVSLPILIGAGGVLTIFYKLLWKALYQWQVKLLNRILFCINQAINIFCSIYQIKYLLFKKKKGNRQCKLDTIKLAANALQFYICSVGSARVQLQLDNEKATYSFCSFREFMFNECPQNIYDQVKKSIFNAQLYFVRSVFKFDLLSPQQQQFLKMVSTLTINFANKFYLTHIRMQIYRFIIEQLIPQHKKVAQFKQKVFIILIQQQHIQFLLQQQFYNLNLINSLYNYTQSVYQTCKGNSFTEPYDPRCRFWYQYAQQNKGMFVYQPYNDATTGALQMSVSTQILKDSQFFSVNTIIFKMQNLVKVFDQYLSENSYTVLFHEFNATVINFLDTKLIQTIFFPSLLNIKVFYHPLLLFYQTTTWIDVEFFNVNQLCNNSPEEMDICQYQKTTLKNQINSTIQFIKDGNYSIERKENLNQLYQYWERFNQKQASIVFPIQSKLKGQNNQQPYSNSILLIARVVKDNSDQLKLFNLLNVNAIRAYILIGFCFVSIMILIFIINYGYFLIFQIQNPIQLLILFLNKSYYEQFTYQKNSNQSKLEKQNKQQLQKQASLTKRSVSVSKKPFEKQSFFQRLIQKDKQQKNHNNNIIPSQMSESSILYSQKLANSMHLKNQFQHTFNNHKTLNLNTDVKQDCDHVSEVLPFKNLSQSPKGIPYSSEKMYDTVQESQIIQKNYHNVEQSSVLNTNYQQMVTSSLRTVSEKSNYSMLTDDKNMQQDKNQILQGLKPLFYEMKVIKNVFQDLEGLINYTIDAQNQNSEDFTKSLFHFSKAKSTFMQLKNDIGLGRCYYNLGIVSIMNNSYSIAQEYFECAIQVSFENLGIDYENLKNFRILNKSQKDYEKQILILSKRIFSKAYCLKQSALQAYYRDKNVKCQMDQINCQNSSDEVLQQLKQSLSIFQTVQKFVENNKTNFLEIFQIFLYQEIIEILMFLKQNQNNTIENLLRKVEVLFNSQNYQENHQDQVRKISFNYKQYEKQESLMKETSNDNNNGYFLTKQIIQIQKSKQKFLIGLHQHNQNNIAEAIQFFTSSLEEGSYYSPSFRKKVIHHLTQEIQVIKNSSFQQMVIEEKNSLIAMQNSPIDFIVLLELDYYRFHSNVEHFLENIYKQNFFKENDRMQILVYQSEIHVFMPFTIIKNEQHMNLIIDSLKEIQRTIIEDEAKKQLSWQEALIESFNFIYDFKMNDLAMLKKHLKESQNQQIGFNQKNIQQSFDNNLNNILDILKNDTKKVILLFSKEQENNNQQIFNNNLHIEQKLIKQQKPFVYHLKEYPLFDNDQTQFDSPQIRYELFYQENLLINKLIEIRNLENLNDESEFLSILYSS